MQNNFDDNLTIHTLKFAIPGDAISVTAYRI